MERRVSEMMYDLLCVEWDVEPYTLKHAHFSLTYDITAWQKSKNVCKTIGQIIVVLMWIQGWYGTDGGDFLHRVGIETDTETAGQVLNSGSQFCRRVYDSRPGETPVSVASTETRLRCQSASHQQIRPSHIAARDSNKLLTS